MGQGIGRVPPAPAVGDENALALGREPISRYIAQQRTLRGIDLDELAARTRIPRRSLERLEAGAFDQTPDGFSRGFVRTVAEAIGLDPDEAVARMLVEPDLTREVGNPRIGRALLALAALVLLAALGLGAREWAFAPTELRATTGELPVRRDYVRALAEARGIAADQLTPRDAVLPAQPLLVEAPVALAAVPVAAQPKPAAVAASTSTPVSTPAPTAARTRAPAIGVAAPAVPAPAAISSAVRAEAPAPAAPASESGEPAPALTLSPDAENRD